MTIVQEKTAVPPLQITGIIHMPWATHALRAAVEMDIFSAIKRGNKTTGEIAKELSLNEHALEILLNALVSMETLSKKDNKYQLSEVAETYLIKGAPLYMGNYILQSAERLKAWYQLSDVVKTGKPLDQVDQKEKAEEFFPGLAAAIFPMNYFNAQVVAKEINADKLAKGARVLDIACGTGVWSIPIVEANKGVQVDALDFPKVLDVTRDFAKKFNIAENYQYLPGDWRDVKLEPNSYDVIILGHILHSEGAKRSEELIGKCHEALKPGGRLVIAEFYANSEKTGPVPAALFAINMLLMTTNGCVFSQSEIESILRAKGFAKSQRLEMPGYGKESPIMVATK